MPDYKATPKQWAAIEELGLGDYYGPACILELRARVEALEAANYARHIDIIHLANAVANQVSDRAKFFADVTPDDDDCQLNEEADIVDYYAALAAQHQGQAVFHEDPKPSPNFSQIGSSLVVRVNDAVNSQVDFSDDALECTRVAIREVATWLREQHDGDLVAATVLELEAER